jgi:hypothetical protein
LVGVGISNAIPTKQGLPNAICALFRTLSYYAIDQLTGSVNPFFTASNAGGSGVTVAFDRLRNQFYVRDGDINALSAFSYTSNSMITQKWQTNPHGSTSVAIGPGGEVYGTNANEIYDWSPADGHVIQSTSGLELAYGFTPALSANSLFTYGYDSTHAVKTTEVFDLGTLAHVRTLPRGQSDANTPQQSPGAVFDQGYILYHSQDSIGGAGFGVYFAVPEPAAILLVFSALPFIRNARRPA